MKTCILLLLVFTNIICTQHISKADSLFFTSDFDSVHTFLANNVNHRDSTLVRDIISVTDEKRPYHTPNFELMLDEKEKICLMLLDNDNNLLRVILNQEFERGHYLIYLKQTDLENLLMRYIEERQLIFKFLLIRGSMHEYKRWMYTK